MSDVAPTPAFEDHAPVPRRLVPREKIIQSHGVRFVKAAVDCPHMFAAHDRGQNVGARGHLFEAKRGVRKGWPDTELILPRRTLYCEWKAPGNKPDEDQEAIGARLEALGREWFWADSIIGFAEQLFARDVPLRPGWRLMALRYDALAASEIAKKEMATPTKKGRSGKRAPRFVAGKGVMARARRSGILL